MAECLANEQDVSLFFCKQKNEQHKKKDGEFLEGRNDLPVYDG